MKVSCDFLPNEYKSFILDTRALILLGIIVAASLLVSVVTAGTYSSKIKRLEGDNNSLNAKKGRLAQEAKVKNYPQDRIRALINKFRFIRQALGKEDFPYLRFYQSLEDAIPKGEDDGTRRIGVTGLKGGAGGRWSLAGTARHWEDVLKFEDLMNSSTWENKKNFADVQVFNITVDKDGTYTFDMQFRFVQ